MKTPSSLWKGLGLLALGFLLAAPVGADPTSIPVVGVDADGNPIDEEIPGTEYSEHLSTVVSSVNDSMTEALATQQARASWKLTTVSVGIGFGAEVGIGPILTAKATPRFRVVFSRNDDPVIP